MSQPLLSAHMCGIKEYLSPDSISAAKAAVDDGVNFIEFDVRATKDGKFVISHDACVYSDNILRPILSMSEAEVLKANSSICRLEDMLHVIKDRAFAHVDLKDTVHEVEIVDLCEHLLGAGRYIITTLEDESVSKIRRARPEVQVALSLGRDTRELKRLVAARIRLSEFFPAQRVKACNPTMLAVYQGLQKYGVVRWAHRNNLPVLLWTVDSSREISKAWANNNIWAFTTNNPRGALALKHKVSGK